MGLLKNFLRSVLNIDNVENEVRSIKTDLRIQKEEMDALKKDIHKANDVSSESKTECSTKGAQPTVKSAKDVILDNIAVVKPFLQDLTGESFEGNKWNDLISSLNNKELNDVWPKIKTKADSVLRILAFWGFRPELCTSFTCTGSENTMYEIPESDNFVVGAKYSVVSKCWIYTDASGSKQVLIKGSVKKAND